MSRVVHFSNRVEIPKAGAATAGGLDEVIAHTPDGQESLRIGWNGEHCERVEDIESTITTTQRGNTTYVTFAIPKSLFNPFYNEMSNGFLWPLFHHRTDIALDGYNRDSLSGYTEVNKLFAKIGSRFLKDDDKLLIHDFHLFAAGEELRKLNVDLPMGFFLHIPTPSADLLEELPSFEHQELVRNVLGKLYHYDFVGCQSQRDLMNLKSILDDSGEITAPKMFQTEVWRKGVVSGINTHFGAFPVAGNNELYEQQAKDWVNHPDTLEFIRRHAPNSIVGMIGLDRLDYTKGLVSKAHGVGRWLHEYGKKGETLNLLQIAPFGRQDVPAYQVEKAKVITAFEGLRTQFSDPAVLYMDKVPRHIFLGMARKADGILISPIRDGYNLVASETTVAKDPLNPAVTILSKFAGAAGILRGACILVDPTQPADIAKAIQQSRKMTLNQRQEMHAIGMEALKDHTSERWLHYMTEAIAGSAQPH